MDSTIVLKIKFSITHFDGRYDVQKSPKNIGCKKKITYGFFLTINNPRFYFIKYTYFLEFYTFNACTFFFFTSPIQYSHVLFSRSLEALIKVYIVQNLYLSLHNLTYLVLFSKCWVCIYLFLALFIYFSLLLYWFLSYYWLYYYLYSIYVIVKFVKTDHYPIHPTFFV